jgi:hypothetical protein
VSELDGTTESVVATNPVAPPSGGETPVSTPAPVDTTVSPDAEPSDATKAKEEPDRKTARALASQRRTIGELQREIGRMQGLNEAKSAASPPAPAGPPKQSDFKSFDEWQAAIIAHAVDAATEKVTKAARERDGGDDAGRAVRETGQAFWSAAAKEAKDQGIKDFAEAEKAIKSGEVVTSPAMSHFIIELAENKAALVAWLAENDAESERIAKLDPVAAGTALTKVDAKLAKPASKPTGASPPPPILNGSSTPQVDLSKVKDMNEYARLRGFK